MKHPMAKWRPRSLIRVIALGLDWHEGRLLAVEVVDDAGRIKQEDFGYTG